MLAPVWHLRHVPLVPAVLAYTGPSPVHLILQKDACQQLLGVKHQVPPGQLASCSTDAALHCAAPQMRVPFTQTCTAQPQVSCCCCCRLVPAYSSAEKCVLQERCTGRTACWDGLQSCIRAVRYIRSPASHMMCTAQRGLHVNVAIQPQSAEGLLPPALCRRTPWPMMTRPF